MRKLIGLSLLALLAACGGGAATNASNDAAANMAVSNAAAGADGNAAMTPATNQAAAPANSIDDLRRADEVNECVQDVANELPAGTDVNAFCGCAVDRMKGGRGEREAMEACAAQMGISTEGM